MLYTFATYPFLRILAGDCATPKEYYAKTLRQHLSDTTLLLMKKKETIKRKKKTQPHAKRRKLCCDRWFRSLIVTASFPILGALAENP